MMIAYGHRETVELDTANCNRVNIRVYIIVSRESHFTTVVAEPIMFSNPLHC